MDLDLLRPFGLKKRRSCHFVSHGDRLAGRVFYAVLRERPASASSVHSFFEGVRGRCRELHQSSLRFLPRSLRGGPVHTRNDVRARTLLGDETSAASLKTQNPEGSTADFGRRSYLSRQRPENPTQRFFSSNSTQRLLRKRTK